MSRMQEAVGKEKQRGRSPKKSLYNLHMPPLYEHWGEDYLGGIPEFSRFEIEDFKKEAQAKMFYEVRRDDPLVARWFTPEGARKAIQVIRAIQSKDAKWARFLKGFPQADEVENGRDLRGLGGRAGYLEAQDTVKPELQVVDWTRDEEEIERLNLQGAGLSWANLQGADLLGANLQGAVFIDANLQGANLLGAKLRGAHLEYANLQGVILLDAKLQGARLPTANLQGAWLMDANLQGVDFRRANLRGANFKGAKLQVAVLNNVFTNTQQIILGEPIQSSYRMDIKVLEPTDLSNANVDFAVLTGFRLMDADWNRVDGIHKTFTSDVYFRDTALPERGSRFEAPTDKEVFPYEKLADAILHKGEFEVSEDGGSFRLNGEVLAVAYEGGGFKFNLPAVLKAVDEEKVLEKLEKALGSIDPNKRYKHWNIPGMRLEPERFEKPRKIRYQLAKELYRRARSGYLSLKNNFLTLGRYDDASACAVREKECEKKMLLCDLKLQQRSLKNHYQPVAHSEVDPWWKALLKNELGAGLNLWKWLGAIWRYTGKYREYLGYKWNYWLSDYGESPFKILKVVVWTIILGTAMWGLVGFDELVGSSLLSDGGYRLVRFGHSGFWATLFKSFYCSVISFTTIGFGDVHPVNGWGRAVAAGEAFAGIYLMAMFIWTLGRKVAGR